MLRHLTNHLKGIRVRTGMRLKASVDLHTTVLAHHDGPYTGGFPCIIPKGTVLLVYDPKPSLFFSATIPDKAVADAVMPLEARQFSGHSFVFGIGEIGKRLEVVDE